MTPRPLTLLTAGLLSLGAALAASPASAEPPCGRGWRKGEYCGHRHDWRHEERHRAPAPRYAYGYPPPPPGPYYVGGPNLNVIIPIR